MRATYHAHLILLDLINRRFGEKYNHGAPHFAVFSTILSLHPNILLSTLFSNALNLHSSLNARDHVSHPYRKEVKLCMFLSLDLSGSE
jgi:hypothetical protein